MSNVLKELKAEITRLSRKEIRKEIAAVKKVNATQRRQLAELRQQVAGLKKAVGAKLASLRAAATPASDTPKRFWITGKGVKALRKRLGLTQVAFGKLAGVSSQSVTLWERTSGKIGLRKATAARLQEIRGLNKRALKRGKK